MIDNQFDRLTYVLQLAISDSRLPADTDVSGIVHVFKHARALWAVRVLDRWAERDKGKPGAEYPQPYEAENGWFFLLRGRRLWGATLDVARIAAAEALVAEDPTLGEGL